MRKYLSYSILFLTIFSLLPIWSIGQADMGQKPNAFAVLESEFEVSKLSAVQLEAFEARAIQKLRDLSDYYQVVGEDSYPLEMREQAVRLIKDLFSDSLKTIRFSKESATDPIPVYLYFNFSAPPESFSDLPPMDEISIHTPLKLKRKGVYVGETGVSGCKFRKQSKNTFYC